MAYTLEGVQLGMLEVGFKHYYHYSTMGIGMCTCVWTTQMSAFFAITGNMPQRPKGAT